MSLLSKRVLIGLVAAIVLATVPGGFGLEVDSHAVGRGRAAGVPDVRRRANPAAARHPNGFGIGALHRPRVSGSVPPVVQPQASAPPPWRPGRKLPGEFEHQAALLLGCHELPFAAPEVFTGIVKAACQKIPILALVSDDVDREVVVSTLEEYELPSDSVYFVKIAHDTMWIRDYGPVVSGTADFHFVLDAQYGEDSRLGDERVPAAVAALLGAGLVRVPLEVDGGNLLTNGEGLCVSTSQLLVENDASEPEVRRLLRIYYGCEETLFLDPLIGEDTGHVDMFATFTAPDTIVIGSYDEAVDAANAAVLDRNAAALRSLETPRGHLQVIRVPMPSRHGDEWRTYTNVIYANGRLLVPVYSDDDRQERSRALATFARLLPGWDVVALEADVLIRSGGALHCVARNVSFLGEFGLPPSACASPH